MAYQHLLSIGLSFLCSSSTFQSLYPLLIFYISVSISFVHLLLFSLSFLFSSSTFQSLFPLFIFYFSVSLSFAHLLHFSLSSFFLLLSFYLSFFPLSLTHLFFLVDFLFFLFISLSISCSLSDRPFPILIFPFFSLFL